MGSFVALSAYLIRQAGDYMLDAKIREEHSRSQDFAQQARGALARADADALYELVSRLALSGGGRVLILDEYAVVQADSASDLNGARLNRPEAALALNGEPAHGWYADSRSGKLSYWKLLTGSGESGLFILYAAPVESGGVLVYLSPADALYESLFKFQTRAFLMAAGVTAAVCALSLFMMQRFTRPVDELSEGIAHITRGDMQSRVEVRGNNEFAQLARAFNMMCDQLESLNQTRNRFVSDASHELKTPLSTMKILIETLLYQDPMDPGLAKEFLADVNREIDRLSTIIGDLLTLVHMDSGETPAKMAPVRLSEVVSETVSRLLPLSRERGIELNCLIRDQITVQGDAVRLMQVYYNLIDNAIKYTPRGGLVRAELYKSGRRAVFKITDNGMGIPKDDLPRVFDRFYRVDKTRSRDTGGTGLGLSIVRQVAQLHGGEVSVVSEEGKGSTFTVELPCA